jgi:GNAT superfamily N-acetyltransferase
LTDPTLSYERFSDLDLKDPFFDSLKREYAEFDDWFASKREEFAYTSRTQSGGLDGFLYLKRETDAARDVTPLLPAARRLKIGTFKIVPRGTRLGERFIKKAFDHALADGIGEIYVTVFPRHESLVQLMQRYGFRVVGEKNSRNGTELVLLREVFHSTGDVVRDYPLIPAAAGRHFLLSLYPEWHSRLLPDSILKTENASILSDVSHTNSIHKIYLAAMKGVQEFRRGDTIIIYRTKDSAGPAHYRSVATSLCVVEELRNITEFSSFELFFDYCHSYSIFTEDELRKFYRNRRYPWLIRFTYNFALRKRLTRQVLIDDVGLDPNVYWGVLRISPEQFSKILRLAEHDENSLIH